MAESTEATGSEHFHHLAPWQVIVCKECQYAVWPSEVRGHLTGKQHRMPAKTAQLIATEVQAWPRIITFPHEFSIPASIGAPIPELPLYTDRFQCQLGSVPCTFVGRGRESIRKHWKQQHGWSMQKRGGGSIAQRAATVPRQFDQGAKSVHCQRFFPSRHGSSYFEVQKPKEAIPAQVHSSTREAAWAKAWGKAKEHYDQLRPATERQIEKGETDEANPWLKRTGWVGYLEGCDRDELLQSIREPQTGEAADGEEGRGGEGDGNDDEPIERAIWEAMGEVAAISQATVEQSGVMLRLEAIRTEMH